MAQLTIQQAFDLALSQLQAGRSAEAEQLCRQILARQPAHVESLHLLGMIALQAGRSDIAVDLVRRAIELHPNFAEAYNTLGGAFTALGRRDQAIAAYHQAIQLKPNLAEPYSNLGNSLKEMGQLTEAIAAYQQAIRLKPELADAHMNLGNALKENGQLSEAIASYRLAIHLKPDRAEPYYNLGIAFTESGKMDEAIAAYRRAIQIKPDYADAHNNLGNALRDSGQFEQAIASYQQAIRIKPDFVEVYSNLGNALMQTRQFVEAINTYQQAIRLRPQFAEAYSNLGIALAEIGRLDDSIIAYRQAVQIKPEFAEAYCNLGNDLRYNGQFDESIVACRQAIGLNPDLAEAHKNLSLVLLLQGNLVQGWEEFEWRWKCRDFPSARRNFAQPRWRGQPLEGRTLLLHAEQGLGDAIQFIRYLPMVKQRGGRIILECPVELHRVFQAISEGCQILAPGQTLPEFDLHCPLLSLPRAFGTTLADIPCQIPYLSPDVENAKTWETRLKEHTSHLKVGLQWAGNPAHKNDRTRSIKLQSLAPLSQLPGVCFFSLQKGEAVAEAKTPPPGMELIDWTDELNDFADTAALVAGLDLVIGVDSATIHLAGALGKPVWTLLPFSPDWRWLLDRKDSPWYPSMRLFRQKSRGDWDDVIARVAEALGNFSQHITPP